MKNQVDSVRFGIIGSLVAIRDIKKGEEIYSMYGFYYAPMTDKNSNDKKRSWYYENWQKFKANHADKIEYIAHAEKQNQRIAANRRKTPKI